MHRKEAGLYNTAANQYVGNFPSLAQLAPGGKPFANDPFMTAMLGKMATAESAEQLFFLNQRIERTLNALVEIAGFLNGLPGRKNLIWLSGSFPTSIFSVKNSLNPFGSLVNKSAELRHTANLLTVGQVAVYPVDARALPASFDGTGPYRRSMAQAGSARHHWRSYWIDRNSLAAPSGGRAKWNLQAGLRGLQGHKSRRHKIALRVENSGFAEQCSLLFDLCPVAHDYDLHVGRIEVSSGCGEQIGGG